MPERRRPLPYDACCGRHHVGLPAPEVRRHSSIDSHQANVEFIARHKLGGSAEQLHEISRFVREEGRWFYLDADAS